MDINSSKIISITEANQNFSRVARLVEKQGELYIFKNNKPKYKLIDLETGGFVEMSDEEKNSISHRGKALKALVEKLG